MALYPTSTWTSYTTDEFFAFEGSGSLSVDTVSFGDISGAIRKYDFEDAVVITLPLTTMNLAGNNATTDEFNLVTPGTITAVDVGNKIKLVYTNFIAETRNYFGFSDSTYTSASLGLLFAPAVCTKIIANTSSAAGTEGYLLPAGLTTIFADAATDGKLTSTIKMKNKKKNFDNANQTGVFGTRTATDAFAAGDLIYIDRGFSLTFEVNLFDSSSNTVGLANTTPNVDYISNQTAISTTPVVTTTVSSATTVAGNFSTTSVITTNNLKKTYIAPLIIKVVA